MEHQTSSSSPFVPRCTYSYDVFLSFRGEDTRFGFTGNLYSTLSQRGIFTFIDDNALRKGEEITPSLRKAIQESRMSIIIFSENYASSTYCLNELDFILECYTKQNMWILPVFYDVNPSNVRYQTGSYEKAFAKHERRFKNQIEKVHKWRFALSEAAELSGSHFKIGKEYEFKFIEKITEEVSSMLNRRRPLHIADYPVGLKARMDQIQRLMGTEYDNKVIMLGIHGMGGIGKSTLARAMYNLIADQFQCSYFLANVREKSLKDGLVHIQETMLSELVFERNIKLGDVHRGISILKQRLGQKKVLLVVDDIDKKEQLQATAGRLDWFGPGSIIIITTRDKHLLDIHGVEKQYKVDEFNDTEALELFRWNAFKNKEVGPDYKEIMKRAIYCASRLPLALETIGSNLYGRKLDEWKSALITYERIPNTDVLKILQVSYDSLEDNEKEIFLDIACFFRGCTLRYVTNMLEARGFSPEFGMGRLEEKSLIKIYRYDGDENVIMHDLIRSMGQEIVRQQSKWPWKRNRLWFCKDIVSVLEKNMKRNDKIEAMMLEMPKDHKVQWDQEVFGKMESLRMMIINKNPSLRSPIVLPNSLKVLEWWGYPAASLPSNFDSKNLVRLNLSYSYFQWDGPLKVSNLRQLIIRGCLNIKQIPADMSTLQNLTELCVCQCTNLIKIHDSFGSLQKLQRFCAEGCTKLKKIGLYGIKLTSLEFLSFRNCSSLVMFPEILPPMEKLKCVNLEGTAIENLPTSMQNLEGLQILSMERCKSLESNFIQNLPKFPNLRQLHLQDSNLTILPACIEEFHSLEVLDVVNCNKLQEIKGLPPSTTRFSAANTAVKANSSTLNMLLRRAIDSTTEVMYLLPVQRIPEWFVDYSSMGNSLCFWFRHEFPSLTVCAVFGFQDNNSTMPPFVANFNFHVRINDTNLSGFSFPLYYKKCIPKDDHIIILKRQNPLQSPYQHSMISDIKRMLKTNEWIQGNVSFRLASEEDSESWGVIKWIGVYVNRAFRRIENIRFTHPYPLNRVDDKEVALETKKNQFTKAMGLVNELQLKISRINKMKEDLGEQLGAINANISAIEASHYSIKAHQGQGSDML